MNQNILTLGILLLLVGPCVLPCFDENILQSSKDILKNNDQIINNEQEQILDNYGSNRVFFTENQGQFADEVLFQTILPWSTIYLCKNEIISMLTRELNENQHPSKWNQTGDQQITEMISTVAVFENANPNVAVIGEYRLQNHNNYFIGNNQSKWYPDVPNYQAVIYKNLYPGIDLIYYSHNCGLKYDFIIHPNADITQIQIHYKGIDTLTIALDKSLQISTRFGQIVENTPFIYQNINGIKKEIRGRYLLSAPDSFGFCIEEYNSSIPLVIDPTLTYSTYLGGSDYDVGNSITVDDVGNMYITGYTKSPNFPVVNPYDGVYHNKDVIVSKISADGSSLLFSTYIGGTDYEDGYGIAVDNLGNMYVAGYTSSADFPMNNSYDSSFNGYYDVFVLKLSADGSSLVYSTYIGGCDVDYCWAFTMDTQGSVYVVGYTYSSDFPMINPFDDTYAGYYDVFVSKLSPDGAMLEYSTYIGGHSYDYGWGITVDDEGCAYITGATESSDFPMINPYDGTYNGGEYDVFISKFSPDGSSLRYSTFLGGDAVDEGLGIVVDDSESVYVTGLTSSPNFPVENAYDNTYNDYADVFISKLTPEGNSITYSTYLGGSEPDYGHGIALDHLGNAYVVGQTSSFDFPTVSPYDSTYKGYTDVFVSKLSCTGNSLIFSTYLGGTDYDDGHGIAVDGSGDTYVIGGTASPDFPLMNPFDDDFNGEFDVFVSKFTLLDLRVEIRKPQRSLYFNDTDIIEFINSNFPGCSRVYWLFIRPWVIGNITILVDAIEDTSGIDRVEFYVNNVMKFNDSHYPFSWRWNERTIGGFTIKVLAFTNDGRNTSQKIKVWICNIPQ